MKTTCSECGASPCYAICPTQDPYGGDQAAENADYEFNARYDHVSERFAGEQLDLEREAMYDELDALDAAAEAQAAQIDGAE